MKDNASQSIDFYTVAISCVAIIGGFLFGFDSGVINGTVDGLSSAFNSSDVATGFNVASMLLGCAIGALCAGIIADRIGRRTSMMIAAILFVVSAWGSGIATSSFEFIIYRIIGGIAVGAASVMAPAYISEIAPSRYRGTLSSLQQIAIISGLFCAFLSNYLIAGLAGSSMDPLWMNYDAWRWMFWIEMIPAVIFLAGLFFIPESPRFLVSVGREADAENVLKKILAPHQVALTLNEIKGSLGNIQRKATLSDLLNHKKSSLKPIIWVGIGLAVLQQLVGINVVFYYGAVLWQSVGFDEGDALLINVISGAVSIFACIIATLFIDKKGRKPLLTIGSVGMTIALAIMSITFLTTSVVVDGDITLEGQGGIIALVAANAYVFFFNISWGPVMWVMLGEMFPNSIRGPSLSVTGLCQWLANFAITMSFPIFLSTLGLGGAYFIYASFSLLSIFFVVKFVRETKGLALEEMDALASS